MLMVMVRVSVIRLGTLVVMALVPVVAGCLAREGDEVGGEDDAGVDSSGPEDGGSEIPIGVGDGIDSGCVIEELREVAPTADHEWIKAPLPVVAEFSFQAERVTDEALVDLSVSFSVDKAVHVEIRLDGVPMGEMGSCEDRAMVLVPTALVLEDGRVVTFSSRLFRDDGAGADVEFVVPPTLELGERVGLTAPTGIVGDIGANGALWNFRVRRYRPPYWSFDDVYYFQEIP